MFIERLDTEAEPEDWIPVFEALERQDGVSHELPIEPLTETLRSDNFSLDQTPEQDEHSYGEEFYQIEGTDALIRIWWSEYQRKDGRMAEAELAFTDEFRGPKVREVEDAILQQYSAPYFEPITTEHSTVANMNLPENYDQEGWEESVETAVEAAHELQEYHDALHDVSEPYLE